MVNLNKGKNEELRSKCKALSDYMTLINKIKNYSGQNMTMEEAVELAVKECIEDILADFLRKNRGEVMCICITEFNEEVYKKSCREEGQFSERMRVIRAKLAKGKSEEEIVDSLELDVEDVRKLVNDMKDVE